MAVSGFMFIIAAVFVSGKQNKSEFRQGMNEINSQIQQTINDVNNGLYPSSNAYHCQASNSGDVTLPPGASPDGQGTNLGCTFLGKVMQFGVHGTNGSGYNVYTIVGRQYAGAGGIEKPLAASFSQARPLVVQGPGFDLTTTNTIQWSVKVTAMKDRTAGTNVNGLGFFESFPGYGGSTTLVSGSQTVSLIPIKGPLDISEPTMIGTIQDDVNGISDANVQSNPNILMCFDGGGGEYGSLIIGGTSGQRLTTAIQISSDSHVSGCP